jgi:hypothetical protein
VVTTFSEETAATSFKLELSQVGKGPGYIHMYERQGETRSELTKIMANHSQRCVRVERALGSLTCTTHPEKMRDTGTLHFSYIICLFPKLVPMYLEVEGSVPF